MLRFMSLCGLLAAGFAGIAAESAPGEVTLVLYDTEGDSLSGSVSPGQSFTLRLFLGVDEPVFGVSFFLVSNRSGVLCITDRVVTSPVLSYPITPNSVLLTQNPCLGSQPGRDLGVISPGAFFPAWSSHVIEEITFRVSSSAPPAAFPITLSIVGASWTDFNLNSRTDTATLGYTVNFVQFNDCNHNGTNDLTDIATGVSRDCNSNLVPDECEPDADGDRVIDACDACPNTVAGAPVDANGCPPVIPGDFNRDGDVDWDDLATLRSCTFGPAIPRPNTPTCRAADSDGDGDVDQDDFGVFQRCYSGENVQADPNCAS